MLKTKCNKFPYAYRHCVISLVLSTAAQQSPSHQQWERVRALAVSVVSL